MWIFYLYHAFGEEGELVKLRGLAFSGVYPFHSLSCLLGFLFPSLLLCVSLLLLKDSLTRSNYIYFVAVNVRFLGLELAKIIEHKTPEVRLFYFFNF